MKTFCAYLRYPMNSACLQGRLFLKFLGLFLLCLLAASPASAGTLSGVIHNGTTGAIIPRQDVTLIQLQGGMQPLETVQTDAQGRYHFDRPEIGQGPMLVRAPYRGVNYNQNIPPGTATADIDVFEPSATASDITVVNHAIIFQPQGDNLVVGEEFSVHNISKPPATYFSDKGTFEFMIPDGAQIGQVSAAGPAGMPLPQSAIDRRGKGHAIAFAFKPGENTVRISYRVPYTDNQAMLRVVSPLPAQRVVLAGPAGIQIASEGFAPAGNEQGFAFFAHDALAANSPVVVSVSGAGSVPAAGAAAGAAAGDTTGAGAGGGAQSSSAPPIDAQQSAQQSSSAAAIAPPTVFPPRIATVRWILIGGFALLFGLGVVYLWRQPRVAGVPAHAGGA
ncbi:MAG: hypothetical protein GZ088_13780, partial [Acidipila sp.]|nr:hypothetical protein [Acidipila sp.]